MKKKFLGLTCCILLSSVTVNVFGGSGLIIDGKTYVPVRGVFSELGFDVNYDNSISAAIIKNESYTIVIPKGKTYFTVNNKSIKPDTPQKIINGSMYIPLRAIADSIGAKTAWDSDTKVARIQYNGKFSFVNARVGSSILTAHDTDEQSDGTVFYSMPEEQEQLLVNFAQNSIKNEIKYSKADYPDIVAFSESYCRSIMSNNPNIEYKYKKYGCKYQAFIEGYATTSSLTKYEYHAYVFFNVENNEVTDLTFDFARFK